jgi:large subunit ribosomal protein L15
MQQHKIRPRAGSKHTHKRLGIGDTFAGKGAKGQKARVGGHRKFSAGFEGGQISLVRRMPKLGGFRNPNRIPYQPVNLADLEQRHAGVDVTVESLHKAGLIKKLSLPVKLLAFGEVTKKFTVKVDAASKSAVAAVEKAGGKVELPAAAAKKATEAKA